MNKPSFKSPWVLVTAVSAAVVLAVVAFAKQQEHRSPQPVSGERLPSVQATIEAPARYERIAPSVLASAARLSPPRQATRATLVDEFNGVKNGRAFVLSAWTRPGQGGRLYASKIVDACLGKPAEPPDVAAVGPANHLAAIEAYDRLQALCDQFTPDELASYSGRALLTDKADTLSHLVLAFGASSKDNVLRRTVVEGVLAQADPMVFDDLGIRLSLSRSQGKAVMFFDGEEVPLDSSLAAAYYLLPCSLGLACDASDLSLRAQCISGAGCYASRAERVRAEFAGGDSKKFADILQYQTRLASAVASKNVAAFMPP